MHSQARAFLHPTRAKEKKIIDYGKTNLPSLSESKKDKAEQYFYDLLSKLQEHEWGGGGGLVSEDPRAEFF